MQQWGEIKQVTALSADIVGSTELIADLDPELAMSRLRPIVAVMCEEVARFGGVVVSILGDGIFAVFGAPRAEEGHALLACEAALAMQRLLSQQKGAIRIRVGLHSGAVVADAAEGGDATKQTVYGLTAHVANRLQALAAPGAVVMSVECHSLVQAVSDTRRLGRQTLRGLQQEFEIFELIGIRSIATSQFFQQSTLSRFQNRIQEMAFLQHHLDQPTEVSVIGIAGGPGTGKSRLCYEFAQRCRARRIPVYEVRTQPYGRAAPLQPILEFLRSAFFKLMPAQSPASAREQIRRRLKSMGSDISKELPVLYEFLGISDETNSSYFSATSRHERLVAIIRALIKRYGRVRSVIIAEDLQWLDEASEAFLATLLDRFADSRILLVFNYRPSYAAPWMRSAWFEERSLLELPQAEIEALIEERAGRQPILDHLRSRVAQRSGGNPFFAEELIRSLIDRASMADGAGASDVLELPAATTLPITVQGAIAARLDNLNSSDRALLHMAAVVGQEIRFSVLDYIAAMPKSQLAQSLDRLCKADLLTATGADDERVWIFRHPLIQEVAYATQLRARREILHASIAQAMRQHYAARIGEVSALIAYHHEAAGQTMEAAEQMEVAARWVGSKSPAQATRHWHKVRELLQRHLDDPAARALCTQANAQIAWLGWREGMTAAVAKPYIDEAVAWAEQADEPLIPLLLFVDARIAGASGGADSYAARLKQALRLLTPTQRGRAATLYAALSQAYGWGGLQKHALKANQAAMARIVGLERFDHEFLGYSVEHWALSLQGRILGRLGRFDEAESCFEALRRAGGALEDPTVQFISHLSRIDAAWFSDDGEAAAGYAEQIAELAREQGSPYLQVYGHQAAGSAKLLRADPAGAFVEFTIGLERLRASQVAHETEAEFVIGLAQAEFDMGRSAEAMVLARETLAVARASNARIPSCRACILLAQASGRTEGAAWLNRADRLVKQTGVALYGRELNQARAHLSD